MLACWSVVVETGEVEVASCKIGAVPSSCCRLTSKIMQTQSPIPPSQVQEKRRFGMWMLVTKKSKPGDTGKNTHDEPTIHRLQTDKNRSKAMPRQASKGKHPTPPNSSPPAPPQSASTHIQNVRNRGGRSAATRRRGRGLGRGHGVSHDNSPSNSPFTGLRSQSNSQNIFQFGGAHTPSSNVAELTSLTLRKMSRKADVIEERRGRWMCKNVRKKQRENA
nr:LINE-type retrotransposon LIb DNA [Ipomoea batatas]